MESQINHDNLDWVIDFDDKNSFGKIRNESLYFDHDLRVWVDLEYSLSAIREPISKVDVYSTYQFLPEDIGRFRDVPSYNDDLGVDRVDDVREPDCQVDDEPGSF